MPKLPRGVFYEPHRDRYRVRLYYCQQVIWRTYHQRFEEAVAALREAQMYRLSYVRSLKGQMKKGPPQHLTDLLQ